MPDKATSLVSKTDIDVRRGHTVATPVETGSFSGMVKALNGFVDTLDTHLDESTKQKARAAGAMAGMNEEFVPAPKGTLAGESYNAAAYDVFVNKTVTDSLGELDELHAKHNTDPDGMGKAGAKLGLNIASTLPAEVRPTFLNHFQKNLGSYVRDSRGNQVKAQIDEHKATFENTEFVLHNRISSAAEKGDIDVANTNLRLYIDQLDRNGPSGTRALTNEQVAEKKRKALQGFEHSVVTGEFNRAPDKLGYIRGLNARPEFRDLYDDTQRKEIINGLYGALNQHLSLENGLRAQAKQRREEVMGKLAVAVINNPSDVKAFQLAADYATANGMDAELTRLHKIRSGEDRHEDLTLVRQLTSAVRMGGKMPDGTPLSEATIASKVGDGLHAGTANTLISTLQQVRDGGTGHFTNWEDYKQAVSRAKAAFPTRVNALGQIRDEDIRNASIQAELEATLYDTLDQEFKSWAASGMDPAKRPDPRQKVNLMVNNARKDLASQKEDEALNQIPPQYRDARAIKDAMARKELTESLGNKYYRLLEHAGKMKTGGQ